MTDIVERLREAAQFFRGGCEWPATADAFAEAADEIEELRAALELADAKLGGELMRADATEVRAVIAKALRRS